ncbi:MAG: peptide ABC transporter substrate-binding protein [Aggregatilineales bacterium]
MKLKPRFALLTSLAVVTSMLFGSLVSPLHTLRADSKTLTVAFSQEPDNMNANLTQMAFAQWAVFLCQANLWDYDDKLQPVPVLVQEVPTVANGGISKDGLTTTLKLKPGLKWSDGQPLNADDVVFSYQMTLDKANNYQQGQIIRALVSEVTKVDDLTVKLTTNKPSPYPENIAGVNGFYLIPMHVYKPIYDKDKSIEKADANQNPTVFSGPFMLKEWKRGSSMTFVPNPNYVFGAPKIDSLVIQIFPDPQTSYTAFAAGQVDFVPNLQPGSDPKQIQDSTKDVTIYGIYGSYRESLWLNVRTDKYPKAGHPALKDKRVRQAMRLAINRRGLVKDLLFDTTTVAESLWADSPFEDKSVKFVEYDPEAAQKLLDAAGWVMGPNNVRVSKNVQGVPDGTELSLTYKTTPAAQRKKNQVVIQQELAAVGIKVTLSTDDPTQLFGSWQANGTNAIGDYDIAEYANNTVTTNPANSRKFFCDDITGAQNPGGVNNTGYCNPKMDDLWKVTEQALDPKAGQDAANQIQQIMADEVPVIILYNRNDIYAYATSRFAQTPRIGAGITNQWFDIVNWQLK